MHHFDSGAEGTLVSDAELGIEMATIAQVSSASNHGPAACSISTDSGGSTSSFVACRIEDITVVDRKEEALVSAPPPTIYSVVHHDDVEESLPDENTDLDDVDIDDEEVTLLSRYTG